MVFSNLPPGRSPGDYGRDDDRPRVFDDDAARADAIRDGRAWVVHPRRQRARLRHWRGFSGLILIVFAAAAGAVYLGAGGLTRIVLVCAGVAGVAAAFALRAQILLSRLVRRYDFDTLAPETRRRHRPEDADE